MTRIVSAAALATLALTLLITCTVTVTADLITLLTFGIAYRVGGQLGMLVAVCGGVSAGYLIAHLPALPWNTGPVAGQQASPDHAPQRPADS
jgi:hypothetical protein